jgi:hypothetical protein
MIDKSVATLPADGKPIEIVALHDIHTVQNQLAEFPWTNQGLLD